MRVLSLAIAVLLPAFLSGWLYEDTAARQAALNGVMASRATPAAAGLPDPPQVSHPPGFYTSGFDLEITHRDDDVTLYYTLDGSTPTTASSPYTAPISIANRTGEPNKFSTIRTNFLTDRYGFREPQAPVPKGTVVRVLAVKEGQPPVRSKQSYFVYPEGSAAHTLPVISIASDSLGLFGHNEGIYVPGIHYEEGIPHTGNYYQRGREWEREAAIEFFDENGELQFAQNVGIRIHGGFSRRYSHKSLRIYARSEYGESRINYPVFQNQEYSSYNRLILRNSGNDQGYTMIRDAAAHELVRHINFDTQAHRPVVVYINGEYWGIHNIRERYDRHYLERVYGVDPGNVDILTGNHAIVEGFSGHYRNLLEFVQESDMTDDASLQEVRTRMDLDNYLDYYSAQVYFVNTDWPHSNIDFWRLRTHYNPNAPHGHDGRWRWLFYDIDFTFGLVRPPGFDMLNWVTRTTNHEGQIWPNRLFRHLIKNESFKYDFINRMADQLNSAFLPERVFAVMDSLAAMIEPEIPNYIDRWGHPTHMGQWGGFINNMKSFAAQRPQHLRQNILDHFGLASEETLTVDVNDPSRGSVQLNSIMISSGFPGIGKDTYPWTGVYFSGVPVTLKPKPERFNSLAYWLVDGEKFYQHELSVYPDSVQNVTAVFEELQLSGIKPHRLADEIYFFNVWDEDNPAGVYPEAMGFVYMDEDDPGLDARVVGMTFGEYGLDSRTRIEGLGDEGVGFINTASAEGNPGYPGTRLGGAVLVLDTRGVDGVQVGFEAGTVLPNSRVYNLRLQYRTGSDGAFADVLDGQGNPVEYLRSSQEGHSEFIGPVALPPEAIGQSRVELLWRYYHTGEQLDEESGQRAMINLSSIHVATTGDPRLPAPHRLANDPYEFTSWPADSPAGSAPPSMGFVYMDRYDPGLDAGILGFTSGAFDMDARTRVEGLGQDGFALINTASLQGNPGYPGRRLGGAVLNLNTEGQGSVTVEWTGGTVRPNSRVYHLRLQYRTSVDEPFRDVVDATGEPVEYRRFEVGGHRQRLGPVTLPGDAGDQPWVQLLWRYYYTGEREEQESGQRAMLHIASIRVYSYALLGGEPGMPTEFRLFQNYPNPFYPQTTIRFDLPRDEHVRIELYTITGRRVATLEDAPLRAGRHSVQVDASALASGVYLYRLHSDEFTETGKLSVIK